jgi:4-amino-4-deoxy-L-arabinose transferase-like glycosyltransferase
MVSDGDATPSTLSSVSPTRRVDFAHILAIEVIVGVVARGAYALTIGHHLTLGLDTVAYELLGGTLARGGGYSDPVLYLFHGTTKATANFVPGYPLFLAGLIKVHIGSSTGFRLVGALCGGVTVLLTGLFGRRVTGRSSIGIVAACLVAISPTLIASDGSIMSETIAVPLCVGMLLAASWASTSRSLLRWTLVGLLAGLLCLVRSEDLLTAIVLVPLAVLVAPGVPIARRFVQMAVALVMIIAVLSPWLIRNYGKFDHRIVLSTNEGKTLAGANCPSTYYGTLLGYWDNSCVGHDALADSDEAKYEQVLIAQGTRYTNSHLSRVPVVAGVRVLRAWGLFEPLQQARLEVAQSRSIGWQQLAWPASLVVLLLAIPGVVLLRNQRGALVLVAGPIVIATFVVAASFGNPRYVVSSAPSLSVAAAVTLVSIRDRSGRTRTRSDDGAPRDNFV